MLTTNNYNQLLTVIRIILVLFLVIGLSWLVRRDIVLSGEFIVSHDYHSPSAFFTELVPKQRILHEEGKATFTAEPVYTTLKYPRPFQDLLLLMTFENPENHFIEFGPQIGLPEVYELHGINHPLLNELLQSEDDWDKTDNALYQKRFIDYRYETVGQFMNGLPPIQSVGYYGVDWEKPYLPDFTKGNPDVLVTVPLRGPHQFYVATNKGTLDLSFIFQDINSEFGEDPIEVRVSNWEGKTLSECRLADDGETREQGVTSKIRNLDCEVADLSGETVLLVDLDTTSDVIMHEVKLNAPYFVAKDHLRLAGSPEYLSEFGKDAIASTEITTSARQWSSLTTHRSTLQSIRLAREEVVLDEPHKSFVYQMPKDQRFLLDNGYPIIAEKGNIELNGRGVYALSKKHYFSPKPWLIDATTDPQVIGIDYLLTDYNPPVELENGVFQQSIQVDLSDVFAPTKALRFQWSIPGKQEQHSFALLDLMATYTSEPITFSNAKEKFLRFIEREF